MIHIIESNEFEYCLPKERVKTNSILDYKGFLELLGCMDINFTFHSLKVRGRLF